MFRPSTLSTFLVLLTLSFGLDVGVTAQKDCIFGYKIYVRDETGKSIANGQLEVSVLDKSKLPPSISHYIDKDGIYHINAGYGSTLKGDFLFKISAEGFQSYERQFNFPVCEIQPFELRLPPKGSKARASYERLFILHGKVFDEDRKPLKDARVEAKSAGGRIYQTYSNQYGYYELGLPKGMTTVRISSNRFPDIVFDNYRMDKNYSVLNVPVCLKCSQKQSPN
jgi:hypothetical protein